MRSKAGIERLSAHGIENRDYNTIIIVQTTATNPAAAAAVASSPNIMNDALGDRRPLFYDLVARK